MVSGRIACIQYVYIHVSEKITFSQPNFLIPMSRSSSTAVLLTYLGTDEADQKNHNVFLNRYMPGCNLLQAPMI